VLAKSTIEYPTRSPFAEAQRVNRRGTFDSWDCGLVVPFFPLGEKVSNISESVKDDPRVISFRSGRDAYATTQWCVASLGRERASRVINTVSSPAGALWPKAVP